MFFPFWESPNIPISPLPMEMDYHMSDYAFCMRLLAILKEQQREIAWLNDQVVKLGGQPIPVDNGTKL